ncbi:YSIRK-type signal peptide-containing protein [Streptococcus mitis]|uniref:YSIRK signal domain/LPXTG anchor domain surface protein n=1 Tax=Streptococcus mitis TaxID=28037 RepID=A0A1X1K0I8_STRMT|nr:YSIRK-type signal peptide-containing protein [Streptococcus mitis]ORO92938.1 YSIRK signal domain/LPXTG anchor domain surface protein [Streptococcus mitis]
MKDIFNKRQRFSIRKFSVGVASVLIGITLFTPYQRVLASTENNLATEIGANSERENSTPTVEKKQESQSSPENRGSISSPAPKDTPIISTRTTELKTSGEMGNNSLTTRASVVGEDRSSTPAVRAASNPSEIKKYELTEEDAKKIKAGVIGSEGNKLDSLLLNGPKLSPEAYTDDDYLKDKDELYIYEKGGKKYVGYNSHPMLEDTDGDGIIDSKEKPDEKLKWNVSERDMIMFMELSYRDDNYIDRVLDHKRPLTESELYKKNGDSRPRYEYMMMNKELGPYWERKKSYHTSSGLDAVLYETKSDFLYLPNGTAQVLAFRGTSDAKDIGADITLGTGRNPQQGIDAENIMRELAKDKSITNLYLTGHSLGGYLVQRAMVEAYELAYSDSRVMSPKEQLAYRNFYNNVLKKGTTFNAPKVVTSLVSGREFWQKGLDSKKIAKSGKMTHYIVDNDSTIRKGVSNDSDVVINVGPTSGGHSSRSYFEADMINRRSEFISGKRISLDETGYQDKKITTVKSLEKVGETAVYSKRGDDIIKSTTVSMKDPDTGQITKNTLDEVFKKDGAKAKVVVTSIQPSIRYEKDATRAKGEVKITVAGISGTRTVTTTYTVNATDGSLIPHEGQPVIKPSTPTVVKVPAKDEVEYLKEGYDIVKNTTTYAVNPNTGVLTPTEKKEVFKKDGAKAKVVVMPIEPSIRYEKDATRAKGEVKITSAGTLGTSTVTTTYTVNATDGSLIPHEEPAVVVPSKPTVVKVPAKDEVEYLKEVDDVAKKTTTYEVNESTGDLIPTVRQDIVSPNGVKSKVVTKIIPVTTRYEADKTKDVGNTTVTNNGSEGKIVTITSTLVNETNGTVTDGTPVVSRTEMVPKVVKVGAKDKVVETPIEPEVEYIKDVEKDFGTPDQRTEGEKGKAVTTTTYDVDPKDGHITEYLGNPVVTPAGKTIVKVGAKTKVERSKDPEGREVINTTTYEVDPKTGKVTPITVRTDGKSKEAKVELEQDPKTGDDTATPKKQDGSIYAPGTKVEVPDADGKGKVPNSDLPDVEKLGTGTTTNPGKPAVEVPNATTPPKVTIFENGVLPDSIELPELLIEVRWIDEDGNVLKPSLKTGNEKDAEHGSISGYEFVRTVIDENEPVMTYIFRKASGSTNPNTIPVTPPKVTIFENGVLPDSIELSELMIEVRWIDEDGNVLKPSVKTGNEKDAEHGLIPGYEFVRTVIAENEPVITHIFRKVSSNINTIPVTPDTNGNTGPDTSALTTPIPVAPVTPDANGDSGYDTATPTTPIPDEVAPNANHEDTPDAIDNGVKSSNSQTVLPNTGTESNETLASLGLLGMLSGLGLALGKKKED